MINRVKAWFANIKENDTKPDVSSHEAHIVAAAALLVEAASVDGHFEDGERATVEALLRTRFDLNEEEISSLMAEAIVRQADAPDAFRFAFAIRQSFDETECAELIEMLWVTVLADGKVDDYEANLIRRVVGLLHITDKAAGDARKRAFAKSGGA